jgi:hypothetical protein
MGEWGRLYATRCGVSCAAVRYLRDLSVTSPRRGGECLGGVYVASHGLTRGGLDTIGIRQKAVKGRGESSLLLWDVVIDCSRCGRYNTSEML